MNCSLYLVHDTVTMVMCGFGIIVTIMAFLSNLVMALYFAQMKRHPGGMIYYKAIIGISMTASIIGQPLETANTLFKTSRLYLNLSSNFCLFFFFCATYHCIAGLTFERYFAIKLEGHKKKMEKNVLTIVLVFLVIAMCIPKFYNLYHIILARDHCKKPPASWMTITAMCTWLLYCSFSINFLTKKAIRFVESYDEIRKRKLGKTQKTNLRRLIVAKRMWLIFSIIWLPYGLVNILQTIMSEKIYEHLNAVSRGITFCSFVVIPWVYYFMDKNYAQFINKRTECFRRWIPCPRKTRIEEMRRGRASTISTVGASRIVVSTSDFPSYENEKTQPI
eukprot:TCONS_00008777-protein